MIARCAFVTAWVLLLSALAKWSARRNHLDLHATTTYGTLIALLSVLSLSFVTAKLSVAAALAAIATAAFVDAQSGFIFDPLVIAGAAVVFVCAQLEGTGLDSLCGAAITTGSVFCIWALSLGRGIGFGDVKLAVVIGAGFGPIGGVTAICLSFIVGATVGIARIIAGKARFGVSIRFGPYLLAGSVCFLAYHRLSDGVIR